MNKKENYRYMHILNVGDVVHFHGIPVAILHATTVGTNTSPEVFMNTSFASVGGKARAKKLSAKRRREIAMMGVAARRSKPKEK